MSTSGEEDYAERELRESIEDTLIMHRDEVTDPVTDVRNDRLGPADELLNWAWTFMCNAERCLTDSADTRERAEWTDGFVKFRDRYHAYLDESGTGDVIPERSARWAQREAERDSDGLTIVERAQRWAERYWPNPEPGGEQPGTVTQIASAAYAQGQRDMEAMLTREMESMKTDTAPDIAPRFAVPARDYDERPSGSLLITDDSENERLVALAHLVAQTTGQAVSIHHRGFRSRFDVYIGGR